MDFALPSLSLIVLLQGQTLHINTYLFSCLEIRETREGWFLLTVKIEMSRGSKSTRERGPSLLGS